MDTIRDMQQNLPWPYPPDKSYSGEFCESVAENPMRQVGHDLLHVMKGLGRVAAECEYADHGRDNKLTKAEIADNVTDFVICAMHIANIVGFDLQDEVLRKIDEMKNYE